MTDNSDRQSTSVPRRIINIADVSPEERPERFKPRGSAKERFDARAAMVSAELGASKLGFNITIVPAGMRAFPFHNHQVNDEMFFIISGSGTVRIGSDTHEIGPGDIISCPCGGPDTAHQIINTGSDELRYLAVSSKLAPEIAEYPDTGKFGILASLAPNADGSPRTMIFVGREEQSLDYWQGE